MNTDTINSPIVLTKPVKRIRINADFINFAYPTKTAIQHNNNVLTYDMLKEQVIEFAQRLTGIGVTSASVVYINLPNDIDTVVLLLACLSLNAKVILQSDITSRVDVDNLMPDFIFSSNLNIATICGVEKADSQHFNNNICFFATENNGPNERVHLHTWLMVTSSGSTGAQKIIQLSKSAVMENIAGNIAALGINSCDTTLMILPMGYSYGLIGQLLSHLYLGATVVLSNESFFPIHYRKLLEQNAIHSVFATPIVMRKCLYGARSVGPVKPIALRYITLGGAYAERYLIQRAIEVFNCNIATTYGMAEAGPRIATNIITSKNQSTRSGNVGWPLPNVGVTIRKTAKFSNDKGSMLGTVVVKSPSIFLGYVGEKQGNTKDNKLISKDIGLFEADGSLRILGRKSHCIKTNDGYVWFNDIAELLYNTGGVLKMKISKYSNRLTIEYSPVRGYDNKQEYYKDIVTTFLNGKGKSITVKTIENKKLDVKK